MLIHDFTYRLIARSHSVILPVLALVVHVLSKTVLVLVLEREMKYE